MRRIYILGDRPGPKSDPLRPMYPHTTTGAAANLARLMDLTTEEYLAETVRGNVWHDGFKVLTKHEAIARLDKMWAYLGQQTPTEFLVIFVGTQARSLAQGLNGFPWMTEWRVTNNSVSVAIPHTSGRTRQWNDVVYKNFVRDRLSALVSKYRG